MEKAETYALAALGAAEGIFKYYIRPELTAKRTWAAIASIVIAHEIFCPPGELLSEAYDRALEKHPLTTTVGTLVLTGHLLNAFREGVDPVHRGFQFLKNL